MYKCATGTYIAWVCETEVVLVSVVQLLSVSQNHSLLKSFLVFSHLHVHFH